MPQRDQIRSDRRRSISERYSRGRKATNKRGDRLAKSTSTRQKSNTYIHASILCRRVVDHRNPVPPLHRSTRSDRASRLRKPACFQSNCHIAFAFLIQFAGIIPIGAYTVHGSRVHSWPALVTLCAVVILIAATRVNEEERRSEWGATDVATLANFWHAKSQIFDALSFYVCNHTYTWFRKGGGERQLLSVLEIIPRSFASVASSIVFA